MGRSGRCRDSQRIDLDLHIIPDSYRIGTHIDGLHIFDYSVRFEHCFTDHVLHDCVCLVDCLVVLSIFYVQVEVGRGVTFHFIMLNSST